MLKLVQWYNNIFSLNCAVLRYFNACGAALDGNLGENHMPESHLIPNAINAVLKNQEFSLFGTDYKTPDGTCVRDYIHVLDLADAHIKASIIGPSQIIPMQEGKLQLGKWQNVALAEFDGPRERKVIVKII